MDEQRQRVQRLLGKFAEYKARKGEISLRVNPDGTCSSLGDLEKRREAYRKDGPQKCAGCMHTFPHTLNTTTAAGLKTLCRQCFSAELRTMLVEQYADQLNSTNKSERVKAVIELFADARHAAAASFHAIWGESGLNEHMPVTPPAEQQQTYQFFRNGRPITGAESST
jgi:hypothetical protein